MCLKAESVTSCAQREREYKRSIKTCCSGNRTNNFSEFMLTPCSGANENAGTRANLGLVNRFTNRGLRNAFLNHGLTNPGLS